ncbi:L,D-transpeptidase [Haloimpatiens lingqiaonensis]|uniref:L,D-transpeptidase n=1 Tax=Haloimpatiens lingqiaonensis TaxID=1380675 RepID=UPI0010FE933B|nr:L,D-transpeptidase [Haloimpatiens lingqiaonensis]
MKKIFKILVGVIFVVTASLIFLNIEKNTVMAQVNQFKEAYSKKDYKVAREIYEANNEKYFYKKFHFGENIKIFLEDNLRKAEKEYIDGKVNYKDTALIIKKIKSYKEVNNDIVKKVEEKINNRYQAKNTYLEAKKLLDNKNFKEALEKIEQSLKLYNDDQNAKDLKNSIVEKYKAYVFEDVNNLVSKEKFDEAISLLEKNKNVFLQKEISNKKDEINTKKSQVEQEKQKKLKEEKERKRIAEEKLKEKQKSIAALANSASNSSNGVAIDGKVLRSLTKFLIYVDINNQTTNVFSNTNGQWNLIKSISCSTGQTGSETPRGTYKVNYRGNWFYSSKYGEGAKYWLSFYGNYLFHSLPMDRNGKIVDYTLGRPASHGCVRLPVEESRWLYNNIPNGTTVYIK